MLLRRNRKTLKNQLKKEDKVKKGHKIAVFLYSAFFMFISFWTFCQLPNVPKPVFDNIKISASVDEVYEYEYPYYKYTYYVTNPSSNQVEAYDIDILLRGNFVWGFVVPDGWDGGYITNHRDYGTDAASFGCDEWLIDGVKVRGANPPNPGTVSGPMGFTSYDKPPMITKAAFIPAVGDYLVAFYDAIDAAVAAGTITDINIIPKEEDIIASFVKKVPTLGPLGDNISVGGFQHWDRLISDTAKAGQLGWITDQTLLASILQNLQAGRDAAHDENEILAHAKLQAVLDSISAASDAQVKREGRDLVYLNTKVINNSIPWPWDPLLTITASSTQLSIGEELILTAKFVNAAMNQPITDQRIAFRVLEGPDMDLECWEYSDENGNVTFSFMGYYEGLDKIEAYIMGWEEPPTSKINVLWKGGPDLKLSFFAPPSITVEPGGTFYISDQVDNIGTLKSPATICQYFLATQPDLSDSVDFASRNIPELQPGEMNRMIMAPYVLPSSSTPQKYYLGCCVDPFDQIVELNEDNNCSFTNLWATAGIIPVIPTIAPPNIPPDCSGAVASVAKLWPPNHKLSSIQIQGVTDPDGDIVTLTVTSITQDEPVNGLGDGDTSPDGFGVGTANPQVRAERSGTGNGRVYRINFKGIDAKGGECASFVTVGVPHDKKDTPIDDGQNYDSTLP